MNRRDEYLDKVRGAGVTIECYDVGREHGREDGREEGRAGAIADALRVLDEETAANEDYFELGDGVEVGALMRLRERIAALTPAEPPPLTERAHHLTWNGTEWVDDRCGCRYHPDDDRGTHGGAPHVHPCSKHAGAPPTERAREWAETLEGVLRHLDLPHDELLAAINEAARRLADDAVPCLAWRKALRQEHPGQIRVDDEGVHWLAFIVERGEVLEAKMLFRGGRSDGIPETAQECERRCSDAVHAAAARRLRGGR